MYNANKKLTAVGYGRVSTDRQADGFSLTNQKKSIVSVADKYGFQLCKYFSDDGYSGTNTNRPGYKSMMRYLKENEIDVVLVYKLDRFHRNETNLYNDMKLFQERGVRFIAINDSIDTSDESTSLLMAVQSAIAANYMQRHKIVSLQGENHLMAMHSIGIRCSLFRIRQLHLLSRKCLNCMPMVIAAMIYVLG